MIKSYLDYLSLSSKMSDYQRIYHTTGEEPIPNDEYDRLRKELMAWERDNPDQTLEFSPTVAVGYIEPSRKDEELRHEYNMLSLENALDEDEAKSWINLWKAKFGPDVQVIGEFKYDGMAISLRFVDGQFVRALTRGDGEYGEDITMQAAAFVPERIEVQGVVEIRGEAIIKTTQFDMMNLHRGERYSNTRNAVAGILNSSQKSVNSSARYVDFVPYDLEGPEFVFNAYSDKLEALKQLEFQSLSCFILTPDKIQSVFEQVSEIRTSGNLPFDIDGMVFKIDNVKLQMELGETTHSPRHAFAYKFPPVKGICTLLDVVFQVGRSGEVAPVAKITATTLMGVIVTSVLLHNEDRMNDRKIAVGNMYEVYRSGDVIPHLGKLVKEISEPQLVKFPEACPSCGCAVVKRGATYYCSNEVTCPAQNIAGLAYAVSRDVLNVDGLAEQTIELMVNAGLVRATAHIFGLTPESIASLHGYTQYSGQKLWEAIRAARRTTFDRFITSLGIPEVGKSTSRKLAQRIFRRKALFELNTPEKVLELKVPSVGPETAANIAAFFSNSVRKYEAEQLLDVLIIPQVSEQDIEPIPGVADKTFVFTGTFTQLRDALENKVLAAGGNVSSSVSAKTDYVVAGDKAGSKKRKADLLNVDVIDERVFLSLFEPGITPSAVANFDTAFTETLGGPMAKELADAAWRVDDSSLIVGHRFQQAVVMTNVMNDLEERENVIRHYLKFYEEIAEKLQLQAQELFPDIYIEPDMTSAITDMMRKFLEKCLSGHAVYLPYLMKKAPIDESGFKQGVEIVLFAGITKPTENYASRTMYWFINSEFWIRDPANPKLMVKVLDIEDSDIYGKKPPPLPPLPDSI